MKKNQLEKFEKNKNREKYFNGNYNWIYIYYLIDFNKYVIVLSQTID